ncbi:MAG: hypothetical protein EA411_03475 [Saprospirales bacterium]|nr:MAG: hypothetical protein EA411_03475 [Saprospirales bacterium]
MVGRALNLFIGFFQRPKFFAPTLLLTNACLFFTLNLWSFSPQENPNFAQSENSFSAHWDSLILKSGIWDWYAPEKESFPALLVLGGSEGGNAYGRNWGPYLTQELGIGVLALSYHGVDGLPDKLESIPLEYFLYAWEFIKKQPGVDSASMGIMGVSKGGELALLLGSGFLETSAVIAAVPSNVVWQGINFGNWLEQNSSWSFEGKDLPYQPYDMSRGFGKILNFYLAGAENPESEEVIIPVEDINAPLLLFSGSRDLIWPSEIMSTNIMLRLEENEYDYPHYHYNFEEVGHYFHHPPDHSREEERLKNTLSSLGGSLEGYREAHRNSLEKTLQFLRDYLLR